MAAIPDPPIDFTAYEAANAAYQESSIAYQQAAGVRDQAAAQLEAAQAAYDTAQAALVAAGDETRVRFGDLATEADKVGMIDLPVPSPAIPAAARVRTTVR